MYVFAYIDALKGRNELVSGSHVFIPEELTSLNGFNCLVKDVVDLHGEGDTVSINEFNIMQVENAIKIFSLALRNYN